MEDREQSPTAEAGSEAVGADSSVEERTAEAADRQELDEIPLPPPSFEFLVLSLRSQAEVHLGLHHYGEGEQRPKPKLKLARHTIDLMAMLLEKTKGNLSLEERRLLENSLTDLRFRYVQACEVAKR